MQLSSFKVDQEVLLAAGSSVQRLKMYPYFDIAHYILVSFRAPRSLAKVRISRWSQRFEKSLAPTAQRSRGGTR